MITSSRGNSSCLALQLAAAGLAGGQNDDVSVQPGPLYFPRLPKTVVGFTAGREYQRCPIRCHFVADTVSGEMNYSEVAQWLGLHGIFRSVESVQRDARWAEDLCRLGDLFVGKAQWF